jgi:hypothetical protein
MRRVDFSMFTPRRHRFSAPFDTRPIQAHNRGTPTAANTATPATSPFHLSPHRRILEVRPVAHPRSLSGTRRAGAEENTGAGRLSGPFHAAAMTSRRRVAGLG